MIFRFAVLQQFVASFIKENLTFDTVVIYKNSLIAKFKISFAKAYLLAVDLPPRFRFADVIAFA